MEIMMPVFQHGRNPALETALPCCNRCAVAPEVVDLLRRVVSSYKREQGDMRPEPITVTDARALLAKLGGQNNSK